MLTAFKAMDRPTREFADLRSALVKALNNHASPSEVAHVRAELAKLLW